MRTGWLKPVILISYCFVVRSEVCRMPLGSAVFHRVDLAQVLPVMQEDCKNRREREREGERKRRREGEERGGKGC